ncbi:MAG: alpha/beta hydrolase [Pseudomonadota bacterium]
MPSITANGLTFEYEDEGPRDGPVLLLIIGLAAQLVFWPKAVLDGFHAAGFRTIRFDNRDIGKSEKLEARPAPHPVKSLMLARLGHKAFAPYLLSDMADDAHGLLAALDIPRAHVLGVSMGGIIGQILAAERPETVASLTAVMSTTNHPKLPAAAPEITKALARPANGPLTEDEQVDRSLAFWRLIATEESVNSDGLRERIRASVQRGAYEPGVRRQMAAILATGDVRGWTRQIKAPTLAIHGIEDRFVWPEAGLDIARNAPDSRFELINGMAHDLPESRTGRIVDLVVDHMRQADDQAAPKAA